VLRSTTSLGVGFKPIHASLEDCGCLDAMHRLVGGLSKAVPLKRIVGRVPRWVLEPCFAAACCATSIRDALEYARRFRRLRIAVETGSIPLDCSTDTSPFTREQAVATARLCFGAALESYAAARAAAVVPRNELPTSESKRLDLARLHADSYFAALWTDAHAIYIFDTQSPVLEAASAAASHVDKGAPSIRSTVSTSSLPAMAHSFGRFVAAPATVTGPAKDVLSALVRSTQSGCRGWDTALATCLDTEGGPRHVVINAMQAALLGMHPHLNPSARLDWVHRVALRCTFRNITTDNWIKLCKNCNTSTKEAIRIYLGCVLSDLPATRAAYTRVGHALGQLRSAPFDLATGPMQAASQTFVAVTLAVLASKNGHPQNTIAKHLAARFAKSPTAGVGDDDDDQNNLVLAPRPSRRIGTATARARSVIYTPSWLGRSVSGPEAGPEALGIGGVNALVAVGALLDRAFRATFTPLWLHAHAHGVRMARLDASQFEVLHTKSPSHRLTNGLDDATLLRIQRLAIQTPDSPNLTLAAAAALIGLPSQDVDKLAVARGVDDAIAAFSQISSDSGARIVTFCKIASVRAGFTSYDLGPRTRQKQLSALSRRFDIDTSDEPDEAEIVRRLPPHATRLHFCLECGRRSNACVDPTAKHASFNEVGIAVTMLRVNEPGQPSEIRCARRSSAALRTAVSKENDAKSARIESLPVTEDAFRRVAADSADPAHAARLRRDVKACCAQLQKPHACGDRCLVRIDMVGRVVRMKTKWYCICSFCGCFTVVHSLKRYEGEICCLLCDAGMLNLALPTVIKQPSYPPPKVAAALTCSTISCRFCGKTPTTPNALAKFRSFCSPADTSGRNGCLPPPLRFVSFCQSHARPWIPSALRSIPMPVILAHILERAVPCLGADGNKKLLQLDTSVRKKGPTSKVHKAIQKQMRKRGPALNPAKKRR